MSTLPLRVKKPGSLEFLGLCNDVLNCQGSVGDPLAPMLVSANAVPFRADAFLPSGGEGGVVQSLRKNVGLFDFLFGGDEHQDEASQERDANNRRDFVGFLAVVGFLVGAIAVAFIRPRRKIG